MGQRVHAKCAAGADVDRLERVVLQRCLGGRRSCLRAKVDIKRRTRLSRSGRRTVGGRGVPCRSSVGGISGWRGVTRDSRRAGRRLRNRGVAVLGVFTGEEEDLQAEKRIYGKDFAYIRDITNFSNVVGRYLKKQLLE